MHRRLFPGATNSDGYGREFDERDNAASPKVAIINETLARKYFHGRNPLGMLSDPTKRWNARWSVLRTTPTGTPCGKPRNRSSFSHEQQPPDRSIVYIRGHGRDLASAARAIVREIYSNLPVMDMKTMQARLDESMFVERSIAALAAAFGFLATLLAAVGLYGVVSYSVARRNVEIGVRIALGATRSDVYYLVIKEVAALVLAGALVGLPVTLVLGRLIESQLFGVRLHDPFLIGAAAAALALVALVAAFCRREGQLRSILFARCAANRDKGMDVCLPVRRHIGHRYCQLGDRNWKRLANVAGENCFLRSWLPQWLA